ncbi:MAG: ABC transporter permease [Defluviitaleaceae bacterium]|nr:ABC transporter permease [Defluviitaleaceae bacterium]
MVLLIGSLQLGLIYALLAMGIFISFRILKIPDLTVDGSFTLGLAVSAALTAAGSPALGFVLGMLAGGAAGIITGTLQTKLRIHPILSGIITMSGLYTVNLYVLGSRSNLTLIGADTVFRVLVDAVGLHRDVTRTLIPLFICAALGLFLFWFFKTHLGMSIRATGSNEDMVRASSIHVDKMKIIAFAISNGCVALSGAVLAQYQGFADIGSGVGILVVGLASVIIGEAFFGRKSVGIGLLSVTFGSLVYRFIIALALAGAFFPAFALRLVSAVIVVLALSLPEIRLRYAKMKKRRRRYANA